MKLGKIAGRLGRFTDQGNISIRTSGSTPRSVGSQLLGSAALVGIYNDSKVNLLTAGAKMSNLDIDETPDGNEMLSITVNGVTLEGKSRRNFAKHC